MSEPSFNLVKQYPYRKRLKLGDIFCLEIPKGNYYFGRIMSLTAYSGGFGPCNKIYVYKDRFDLNTPPADIVNRELFFEPIFINRLGFSRGYMPVVSNVPIQKSDTHDNACYYDVLFKRYIDEHENVLDKPTNMIGTWGLSSYGVLDDLMSLAIGLPLVEGE
jgi:hypothetical protein